MPTPLRLRIPDVQDPDLAVDARIPDEASKPCEIRMIGSCEASAQRPLHELIERMHGELVHKRILQVIVDLSALDSMSAGCMHVLIDWLGRVQDAPIGGRYTIRFRVNPSVAWQTTAMKALACFDTDLVSVEAKLVER